VSAEYSRTLQRRLSAHMAYTAYEDISRGRLVEEDVVSFVIAYDGFHFVI
jgi:hypothetical protein